MNKFELGEIAIQVLTPIIPVQILRGLDEQARDFGDIDFIVPPGMAVKACSIVAREVKNAKWFLAGFHNLGYVCSVTFIKLGEEGEDQAVKLDFINGFSWYGLAGIESIANPFDQRWQSIHNGWSDSRITGALTFFQKIMAAGSVNLREWKRIVNTGADTNYLFEIAQKLGLPFTQSEIQSRGVSSFKKWRIRAASGGAVSLFSIFIWFFRAFIVHLKFKLGVCTGVGLILGVSGLDGSGKSTLINRFIKTYRKAGGVEPKLVHFLPHWIPMPHQIFRRKKTQLNYTRPYSEPPVSSWINGGLRLSFYLSAFTLARLVLWIQMRQGQLIILDRNFLDFASDPTRARIPVYTFPRWLLRILTPTGRMFFVDASPEIVVKRKAELTLEKARLLQVSYKNTCGIVEAKLLNGDNSSDAVFEDFLGYLSQEYMQRIEDAAKVSLVI